MTGCRIGKVTDKKTGNSVHRFPEKNVTVYTTDVNFAALNKVNQHVRDGEALMVAVVAILKDGTIYHDFQKSDSVRNSQVLGSIDILHRGVMDWIKS